MPKLTLILLPGMDGTGDLFVPLVNELAEEFNIQVIRYPNTEALDYDALELIASKSLPLNEPFVVLGESFSGPIAISIAATRPNGLLGIILCASFCRNPRPTFSSLGILALIIPVKLMPLALLNQLLLGSYSNPKLRSTFAAALSKISTNALRARVRAVLTVDVSAKLKTIKIPLLYLLATQDRVVPQSAAESVMRVFPTAIVVSIDAPHFLLQVAPQAAAVAIKAFVRDLRSD